MVGHGGSSAGSYLADPTSPIPSQYAVIILFQSVPVHQLSWLALQEVVHVADRMLYCIGTSVDKTSVFAFASWHSLLRPRNICLWFRGRRVKNLVKLKLHAYYSYLQWYKLINFDLKADNSNAYPVLSNGEHWREVHHEVSFYEEIWGSHAAWCIHDNYEVRHLMCARSWSERWAYIGNWSLVYLIIISLLV